eukprot:403341615
MSKLLTLKIDHKKAQIGQLKIGDSISKILSYIQLNVQIFGKIEIISTKGDACQPIFIIMVDSGFKLRFEALHQTLDQIETVTLIQDGRRRFNLLLKDQSLNGQLTMNYTQISNLMGPTYPPRIIGNLALVTYDSGPISFLFEYSEKEFKDSSNELTVEMLLVKENKLVKINLLDPTLILFGDHLMDILRLLGNPNKEYHHEGFLFLNYLNLGMDLKIDSTYRLQKFILHTNQIHHPYFGFHDRCYFELFIDKGNSDVKGHVQRQEEIINLNEELKESGISLSDQIANSNYSSQNLKALNDKKKKKKQKQQSRQEKRNNISMTSTKDSQLPQRCAPKEKIMVTPTTKFSQIKELLIQTYGGEQKDNSFYIRNVTNDFSTHYHAFKSFILEIIPDGSDLISSVTLFQTN